MAWRSLSKNKFFSVINLLGLAIATAAFLLIINFVSFEYSYGNFHKKAADIYRITLDLYKGSEYVVTDCETHPPLAPLLQKEVPEVVNAVRVQRMEEIPEITSHDQVFRIDKIYAAEPSMFSMFNYEFKEGTPAAVLNEPMQAVLTETMARRLFGNAAARGKTFMAGKEIYTVTGIIKDPPLNTHLKFDILISFLSLERMGWNLKGWNGNNNYTYVQLIPGANLSAFNEKLRKISKAKLENDILVAQPIKDIHLYSHKTFEPEVNGDIKTVQFLFITAILILLVGSVNYVNLTTARAAERIKETGMRLALPGACWCSSL